jgi:DNA-3-methyladenine glycosylase II
MTPAPRYDVADAVRLLRTRDPVLDALVAHVGACPLAPRPGEPYAHLIRSITAQQVSTAAARTIHARLIDLLAAHGDPDDPRTLASLDADTLRTAGVSRSKAASMHDLAAKSLDGIIPSRAQMDPLDDAEIVERLTQVRGIGVWTAQMLLLFTLHRPDVLPLGDLAVRQGFALVYGGPDAGEARGWTTDRALKATLTEHAASQWAPFRSVGSWYLWRGYEAVRAGTWTPPA